MTNNTRKFLHITAYLGTALFFHHGTAHAGFEWSPAPAPEKVMSAPEAVPPSHKHAPIMDFEQPVMPMAAPRPPMAPVDNAPAPVAPVEKMNTDPVSPMAPIATVSPVDGVKIPPAPKAAPVYSEIQGFGSDIPLVTAMSQIVPADYAYSLDDKSKLGTLVSWSGNVPWNEALQNAVDPLGLVVMIVDKTVWLRDEASMQKEESAQMQRMAFMTEQKEVMPESAPVEPMMVMPAAADVAPLSSPPMKNKEPMAAGGSNYDSGYDAYPRRRNPMDMMMKADQGEPGANANAAPETLNVSNAAPMDMQAAETLPNTSSLVSGGAMMPTPPAPRSVGYEPSVDVPPAPALDKPTKMDPFEIRFWQAEKGASLRDVLTQWGAASGTRIYWNSPYDYRLPAALRTHATFPDAVTQILMAYQNMEPRPLGRLHPNLPDGPSVLVVENYGAVTQ